MPPRRYQSFDETLHSHVRLLAWWETERDVVRFAAVLVTLIDGRWQTVELFDCSHDERNDRHRYRRDGTKGAAETFHRGTPAEAMRAAFDLIRTDFERMIERWRP